MHMLMLVLVLIAMMGFALVSHRKVRDKMTITSHYRSGRRRTRIRSGNSQFCFLLPDPSFRSGSWIIQSEMQYTSPLHF